MELLKRLFEIYSPSGDEQAMRKFIKRWIKANVPGAGVRGDRFGNLYITKGEAAAYPCVVAHLDQVQKPYPADYRAVETDDIIFGYSPSRKSFCGLGADDKCGIWIALNCLAEFGCIKVAFFSSEETGCQGSSQADMKFFDDTMYIVEPDRRGSGDLITSIGWGDLCSDDFVEAIRPQDFGYKPTTGLMTDVEALRESGYPNSCINLSCGYYNPHSEEEFVVKADVVNALNFVRSIIANVTMPYPFRQFCGGVSYGGGYYSGWYDDYYGDMEYELYDILDYYADEIKGMSSKEIYEHVKGIVKMGKKKAMRVIRDWMSVQM